MTDKIEQFFNAYLTSDLGSAAAPAVALVDPAVLDVSFTLPNDI